MVVERANEKRIKSKREAKNTMVSVAVTALTLGVLGVFMQRDNPFQAFTFLIVAIVFMAFYAMKYNNVRNNKNANSRPKQSKRTKN